mmetsp:Transcript_10422/g.17036  ORF Transcript_10422/g.17036 Transcript_10422/m.17036 type:complete len:296 (-) Transcript_10422:318-1205(-)
MFTAIDPRLVAFSFCAPPVLGVSTRQKHANFHRPWHLWRFYARYTVEQVCEVEQGKRNVSKKKKRERVGSISTTTDEKSKLAERETLSFPKRRFCCHPSIRPKWLLENWNSPSSYHLIKQKLFVRFAPGVSRSGPLEMSTVCRKYTLTHSDITANLFLTVASKFDQVQLSDLSTSMNRDEVLAEWGSGGPAGASQQSSFCLRVHCKVGGGLVSLIPGTLPLQLRNSIFERHLPQVLEAIRHGDALLFERNPELDLAPVWVHFHAPSNLKFNRVRYWGVLGDYAKEVSAKQAFRTF